MINVLALGSHTSVKEIVESLVKNNVCLSLSPFSDVRIEIINNKVEIFVEGKEIKTFDFVWIESAWGDFQIAYAITSYLDFYQVPHTLLKPEYSKLSDIIELALHNINIPNTFYCQTKQMARNVEYMEKACKYPMIIKNTRGSLGKGIFLAKNKKELLEIINTELIPEVNYVCQQYIPNNFDYRIIVSDQTNVLTFLKRERVDEEFKNNSALGAQEIFLSLDTLEPALEDISLDSSRILDLDWTGVDIVQSTFSQKYYILELNRRPGLTTKSVEVTAAYHHILGELDKTELDINQ